MPIAKNSKWAGAVLALFCLPFCAAGLISLFFAAREFGAPVRDWQKLILLGGCGVTFAGVGFGLLYAYRAGSRMQSREAARQALHPHQPWMWREDWAAGRVQSSTRSAMIGIWIFAIFWNLVSSPILIARPPVWQENKYGFLALLFPLIGVALLCWAILQSLRARRFGKTVFAMESVPASLGGELRGSIQTRFSTPPENGVQLKLSCIRRTVSGTGKDRSVNENILWREESNVSAGQIQSAPGTALVPVRFTLPADGLESNPEKSDMGIFWFLSAEASLSGVDYKDEFEIPVFGTKHGPVADTTSPFASHDAPPSYASVTPADLARVGIIVGPAAEGTEFRFTAARNPGAAASFTAFTLLWTGFLWFLRSVGAPSIFPIIFGLFELLFIVILLDMWFGATRITIGNGELRKRYLLLGMPLSTRTMSASDISAIKLKVGMQSGGRGGTPYYDLRAVLLNGKEQTLAGGVKDKHHAEWLAAQLSSALGLKGIP